VKKKFLALLAVAALLAPAPASAEYSKGFTLNYGSGGDTVKAGVQALDSELVTIYDHLNALYRLQGGDTEPADKDLYDVWFDPSPSPALKWWDGGTRQSLGASGNFVSGVTLDDGIRNYTRGLLISRANATTARISASSAAPATVAIGNVLLQNAVDTDCSFFSAAAGQYDLYVEQDGTATTWLLKRASHPLSASSTQRVVGEAYYTGTEFTWVRSYEVADPQRGQTVEAAFDAYRTNADQSLADDTAAIVAFDNESLDTDGWFTPGADAKFTPLRAGWYDVHASIQLVSDNDPTDHDVQAFVKVLKNGSAVCDNWQALGNGVLSDTARINVQVSCSVEVDGVDDYLQVQAWQDSTPNQALTLRSGTVHSSAFWGRWAGRRY